MKQGFTIPINEDKCCTFLPLGHIPSEADIYEMNISLSQLQAPISLTEEKLQTFHSE
jgi:hypothetical protein